MWVVSIGTAVLGSGEGGVLVGAATTGGIGEGIGVTDGEFTAGTNEGRVGLALGGGIDFSSRSKDG